MNTRPITPAVVAAFGRAFAMLCIEQERQAVFQGQRPCPRMEDGTFDMVHAEEGPCYEGLVHEIMEQYGISEIAMPDGSEPPLLKQLRDSGYAAMRELMAAECAAAAAQVHHGKGHCSCWPGCVMNESVS